MMPERRGCISFTLFGIPIEIQPFSWLILGVLGLSIFSNAPSPMQGALMFIVAGMLTLLAHELGHALVGRCFTKITPYVVIGGLGGATHHPVGMPGRMPHFLMVLAGPAASYILGVLIAVLAGIQVGSIEFGLKLYLLHPLMAPAWLSACAEAGLLSASAAMLYGVFYMICFCWTIFNLLPILPMDGGQLLVTVTNRPGLTALIGMVLSALLAIWFLQGGGVFMTLMMGYFAWINWQILRNVGR